MSIDKFRDGSPKPPYMDLYFNDPLVDIKSTHLGGMTKGVANVVVSCS